MPLNTLGIFLIAIGLSMDACCVSATNGMCYKLKPKQIFFIPLVFGVFQGIMPILGYFLGSLFTDSIQRFDHWIAFSLLTIIGAKMIYDAIFSKDENSCSVFSYKMLIIQGIATSIDALAIGVSFIALKADIWTSSAMIALTTFIMSLLAIFVGMKLGDKINSKAEIFGGIVLILIGIKILAEHLL